MKGGQRNSVINLENPESSILRQAINYNGLEMPPTGKLPEDQIAALTKWVKLDLTWSNNQIDFGMKERDHQKGPPAVDSTTKKFWSFQKPLLPKVPLVKPNKWVKTPINAFILDKLKTGGLEPSPPADKFKLLRRAHYNLVDLPPDPADVDAFLRDSSPNVFEKIIDKLLASPQYGERWGRHWLDLIRYAESNSYERDGPKLFVWRYRDYVIRSFNSDKPKN